MPYGDAIRTRISSQCLKRHWRKADGAWALSGIGPEMAVRSRQLPEERFFPAMKDAAAGTPEVRSALKGAIARLLYTPKDKNAPAIKDRQALLIGEPEIRYLSAKLCEIANEASDPRGATAQLDEWFKRGERNNLQAMLGERRGALEAGLEAALFGRMVTSDPEANTDAPIHVAHAFTVHGEQSEIDYFTVVDDLETGTGAGGIFDTELTAGVFYVYVVVDVPLLVANLSSDPALAGKVVQHLVHLIATTSPGAKKGSTAPYAYADFVLAETGDRAPRSLAGAFRDPTRPSVPDAVGRLADHLRKIDAMYGNGETRRLAALDEAPSLGVAPMPLPEFAKAVAADVASFGASS
jgi:CRISPR system Cascade subunit CasC